MDKQKKNFWLRLFIIIAVLITAHYLGWLRPLEKVLFKGLIPLQKTFYGLGNNLNLIGNLNDIKTENEKLKEEIGKLSIDYVNLVALEKENEYLRKELEFLKKENYGYLLANVVSRQESNNEILIIDHGSKNGLKVGLPATVAQGVIVGKIIKVEEELSYVSLLANTQSKLAVSLTNEQETSGILVGQTGASLQMDLIPNNQAINTGDQVITSGLEQYIPRGLVVGVVEKVDGEIGQIFKKAKINPLFDYQNLHYLTIILTN